jgi:hypothetical protein
MTSPQNSDNRFTRWITDSFGLAKADKWLNQERNLGSNVELVYQLQGLARLDFELQANLSGVAAAIEAQTKATDVIPDAALLALQRHLYQSFLWVLAAYELIRTLDQVCSADETIYGPALSKEIKDFKHYIERLRVPLAKLVAAKRHRNSDFPRAYPVLVNGKDVAWQVHPSTTISRQDLSDRLLLLMEKLRAATVTQS